jgi:hypothetical protein
MTVIQERSLRRAQNGNGTKTKMGASVAASPHSHRASRFPIPSRGGPCHAKALLRRQGRSPTDQRPFPGYRSLTLTLRLVRHRRLFSRLAFASSLGTAKCPAPSAPAFVPKFGSVRFRPVPLPGTSERSHALPSRASAKWGFRPVHNEDNGDQFGIIPAAHASGKTSDTTPAPRG